MSADELTVAELAQMLGTTPQRVAGWIKAGLPVKSRNGCCTLSADATEAWLVANHKVVEVEPAPKRRVYRTRAECAEHYRVHIQTISTWQADPTFPGRSATRGKQDGHYDPDEIDPWLEERAARRLSGGGRSRDPLVDRERGRLVGLQCELREHRLAETRAGLIDKATVDRFTRQMVAGSDRLLQDLPERILAMLPDTVPAGARTAILHDMQAVQADMAGILAELQAGDADDLDE